MSTIVAGLPVRRQNKSCDQCRAGKRRCDVQIRVQRGGHPPSWPGDDDEPSKPCSNCKKWKKTCTTEWLKAHQKQHPAPKKRQRTNKVPVNEQDGFCPRLSESLDPLISDYVQQYKSIPPFEHDPAVKPVPNVGSESIFASAYDSSRHFKAQTPQDFYSFALSECPDSISFHPIEDQPALDSDITLDSWSSSSINSNDAEYWNGISAAQVDKDGKVQEQEHHNAHSAPMRRASGLILSTGSPSTSQFLTEGHNRLCIRKGLLKIYHDSLEGALGCWLNERNCPYTSRSLIDSNNIWGSRWGNRILSRVTALDEAYAKCNVLSASNQEQASKVLSLVLMAFGAQWAQATFQNQGSLCEETPAHGVFGRNLQRTLWQQAHLALSRATSNPSFKVIFAAVIFSMTQRQMEDTEIFEAPGTPGESYSASLQKIFELDTEGAFFLDVAIRKLHDHRRRLLDAEHPTETGAQKGLGALKEDDKQTFAMIFWLAIMCDTLGAALTRRSFVLSDADTSIINEKPQARKVSRFSNAPFCDLDGFYSFSSPGSGNPDRGFQIWGDYFLAQKSRTGDVRKESARWPCSYTDAAACLADSAPVKVVFFRRLAHLQDLYYQRASAEEIERAITSTLEVYIHWNNTYGCFMNDCVAHHDSLPLRIQSWYTVIACHWHLAVLILADLIDKLDEGQMTTESNRLTRQTTDFISTLRFRSVYAVSDIGRCSQYSDDLSFSQSPTFHHAVNRAALLTEPWTVVSVRSFSHAGEVLVNLIRSQQQQGLYVMSDDLVQARSRLSDCIQALRLLGRKSDSALNAAKILQAAVD